MYINYTYVENTVIHNFLASVLKAKRDICINGSLKQNELLSKPIFSQVTEGEEGKDEVVIYKIEIPANR